MKKPVLALCAASSLVVSAVAAPTASAQNYAELARSLETLSSLIEGSSESGSGSSEAGPSESGSSTTGTASTETIIAITLAVLGLVGGGALFAVQQGFVQIPDDVARTAQRLGVPGVYPQRGSCHPSEFNRVVDGWPTKGGTSVSWCDGKFARAGAWQTDWIVIFHYENGNWRAIERDGARDHSGYPCYNSYKLRDMGAPEDFINRVSICAPHEIGR